MLAAVTGSIASISLNDVERVMTAAMAQQPPTAASTERLRRVLFSLSEAELELLQTDPKNRQLQCKLATYFLLAWAALSAEEAQRAQTVRAKMYAAARCGCVQFSYGAIPAS